MCDNIYATFNVVRLTRLSHHHLCINMVWINGVLGSHQTQNDHMMEITYALYVKMRYWQPKGPKQHHTTRQRGEADSMSSTDHRQDKRHSYFRHREQIPLLSQLWAWTQRQGLTCPHLSGCRCRREHRRLPGCVRLQRWPPVEHSTMPHHRCVVKVIGRQAPAIVKLYLGNSTPHGTHEHKLSFNCSDMTQILWDVWILQLASTYLSLNVLHYFSLCM